MDAIADAYETVKEMRYRNEELIDVLGGINYGNKKWMCDAQSCGRKGL